MSGLSTYKQCLYRSSLPGLPSLWMSVWSALQVSPTRQQLSRASLFPLASKSGLLPSRASLSVGYGTSRTQSTASYVTPHKSSTQGRPSKQRRGLAKAAGKTPDTEDQPVSLNSTPAVVVALANILPKATYHVFVDNLFLSSDLFRSLRNHGHGATGTARKNCGIHKELLQDGSISTTRRTPSCVLNLNG